MYYQFNTDSLTHSLTHAKAASLLYAMYRSRDKDGPLNGLETWDRFAYFVRDACLKSYTTAGFVEAFCRKAKIGSIRPIQADETDDFSLSDIMKDDSLLALYNEESQYLIMLVRERIQRERMEGTDHEKED